MKRLLLIVGIVVSFFVGYGTAVKAYPAGGVFGRGSWDGYFSNINDTAGTFVLPPSFNNGGTMEAFPSSINTANEFIAFVEARLTSANNQLKTGSAFLVETMLGKNGSAATRAPGHNAGGTGDLDVWEDDIRTAEAAGHINWRTPFTYSLNSYYQGASGGGSGTNDDAFFDDNDRADVMYFQNSAGGGVFAIRWECANPVGNPGFGKVSSAWFANGYVTVEDSLSPASANITTHAGEDLTFRYHVKNNGPGVTSPQSIWFAEYNGVTGLQSQGGVNSGTYTVGQDKAVDTEPVTVPGGALPGTKFCRYILWDWKDSTGGRNGTSPSACATVAADFDLTPQATPSASSGQQGDNILFTYKVSAGGGSTSSSVTCKPVGNTHAGGYVPLPQQDVDRTSDAGYVPPGTTCPQTFAANTSTTVATESVTIGAQAPGTAICRSLVINPKNGTSGGFRASAEACVVVAKKPLVTFMGGDVWAGGDFAGVNPACNNQAKIQTTGRQLSDGSLAGSGVEYAAFALGKILQFGSASRALVTPALGSSSLTFSNIDPANLGTFGAPQHCITDYVAQYSSAAAMAPGTIDVGTQPSQIRHVTGTLTISGNMPAGSKQIYLADGTVTINANLRYPATYSSVNDIPSLIIISLADIKITQAVSNIDATLIARMTLYTCSPKVEPATISTCTNQLTINGATVAGTLDLFRTSGADGATPALQKVPAEIFNLTPEVYLQSAISSNSAPIVKTTDQHELPPRF